MNIIINCVSIEKEYEFEINEIKTVETIIEETVEAICNEEQFEIPDDFSKYILLSKENKAILTKSQTIIESNINQGDTLILI